jgi:hypothetical protein
MKCGRRGCEDYSASPMRWVAALMVCSLSTAHAGEPPTSRPPATSTTESSRLGVEYLVQKAGTTWVYQLEGQAKARGRLTIIRLADWRAHFSYGFGKQSGSGAWFARSGAWLERTSTRGPAEAVVLPALMSRGSTWRAPGSIERGGGAGAQYEVMALDATVELPNGSTLDHCLVVLETAPDGSEVWSHYYAPSLGKVAVRSPRGWVYRLVEFRSGSKHAE